MQPCLVCGSHDWSIFKTAKDLADECKLRDQFVEQRLSRPANPDELKDLTDFFHGENARILECRSCHVLFREQLEKPPAESYAKDEYRPSVMEHQYPTYVDGFRAKSAPFGSLCPAGANIVEVGSHYGAFLQVAAEWGWKAEGVDVGRDTSSFARSKGFVVHNCELHQRAYETESKDAVFIWNCFEQIPDPRPVVSEARRILKPGGLFVVRVPNGFFYRLASEILGRAASPILSEALGYNNLLGFPYLFGHSVETLARVIKPLHFTLDGSLNSELLTLPLPETPGWVEREESQISEAVKLLARSVLQYTDGTMAGPWIEIWFRAA